jgi:YD repeat-containing protein
MDPLTYSIWANSSDNGSVFYIGEYAEGSYQCPAGYTLSYSNYPSPYPASCILTDKTPVEANLGRHCGTDKGNPVNMATGNKFQQETDYHDEGPFPLEFTRTYNRRVPANVSLGAKWRHTYERWITVSSSGGLTTATVYRPDGKAYYFNWSGSAWVADSDVPERLQSVADSNGNPISWTFIAADDTQESYNASGRLTSITSRAGLVITLTYNSQGLLAQVQDVFGRTLRFEYGSGGLLQNMYDPAGQLYSYEYNGTSSTCSTCNNLTAVTYPDGGRRVYYYENTTYPGALTGIIDENNRRFATYAYDDQGRVAVSEHAGGADRYTFTYNTDGSNTVVDPLNATRTYRFVAPFTQFKLSSIAGPACSLCDNVGAAMSYDANGNVASRTDFNGNQTVFSYDLTRNLETSRTEAYGTPQARTITTQWHPTFRLPTQIAEPGRVTAFGYDLHGNLLQRTVTDSATNQSRTWNYTYNDAGQVLTADGPRTDVTDITSYAYDSQGNLASVTNALGQATQITAYDAHGRPLSVTDANGLTTTLAYDTRGRLTSLSVGTETTTYQYDAVGQLTQMTLPDGGYLAYTYDDAHRLIQVADSLGSRIVYTLDAMGNRTREDVYDPVGTLAQTRSRVYNQLSRLAQSTGAANQTTAYQYDNNGNQTAATDPLSHTTAQSFDALNRLTQVTDPANRVTGYGYDANDRVARVTDPRGLSTTYSYNGLDDLTQTVSPDTGTTSRTYDSAGNLATSIDATGATATFGYDALNRVAQISYTRGSQNQTTNFQYDQGANGIGHLTGMTDSSGINTQWTYDAHGRVTGRTQTLGSFGSLSVAYAYDNAGRLSQVAYPSGAAVGYSYDSQGRIAGITANSQPLLTEVQYLPFGAAKSWTWGNGSSYARSFDQDGRPISYPLGAFARSLTYDAAGRITAVADPNPILSQSFTYDSLDRLTGWVAYTSNQGYTYDGNGNRSSLTLGANTYACSYPANSNRLSQVSGPIAQTYAYDAAGHLISAGTAAYACDPRGRLVSASVSGGYAYSY